jgi:hypothetical protein
MPDTPDDRFRQHEEIMKSLTAMLVEQRAMNLQQQEFNLSRWR